jgi:hypothetical protein
MQISYYVLNLCHHNKVCEYIAYADTECIVKNEHSLLSRMFHNLIRIGLAVSNVDDCNQLKYI